MTPKTLSQNSQVSTSVQCRDICASLINHLSYAHCCSLSFLKNSSFKVSKSSLWMQLCDGVPVVASKMLPVKQAVTTTLYPLVDGSYSVILGVCNPNLRLNSQLGRRPGGFKEFLTIPIWSWSSRHTVMIQPLNLKISLHFWPQVFILVAHHSLSNIWLCWALYPWNLPKGLNLIQITLEHFL